MYLSLAVQGVLTFAACTTAAVIDGRATSCNAANVAFVNQRAAHTVYFCDFYLSYPRTTSPFELLGATDTWNACQCIAASAAKPRNYKSVTSPTTSTCSAYTALLVNEYRNPTAFCKFYTADYRTRSTIPGLTVANVQKACSCLASTSTSTSTSKVTTRTVTATSTVGKATTTTSTCSNNALGTPAGNFVSGLASWTATASPTAYASVSTGTSYDSAGSAALLKCTYSTSKDAHASVCSKDLPVCPGQNYTVSFKYQFDGSSSSSGGLSLYNYGWDEMLATVTGPTASGGSDTAGTKAGSWGTVSRTFKAVRKDDMVCVLLQCLSSKSLAGKTAKVTVDNVRVTRVQ